MTENLNKPVLVLGATGATGSLVVKKLISSQERIVALVRSPEKLQNITGSAENLEVIQGTILDLDSDVLKKMVSEAKAVIFCLGHNMTLSGIYGKPVKLVTESLKRVCRTIQDIHSSEPVHVVLMNTTGFRNPEVDPPQTFAEKLATSLIRVLLPPQTDNEDAANYLIQVVGQHCEAIDWVVVRPDSLTDQQEETAYRISESLLRSPIFNSGQTSRINAAAFMAELATNNTLLEMWKFKTPVIYNADTLS